MGSWRQILAEEGCSDERERISSVFLRLEPSPKWSEVLWLFLAVLTPEQVNRWPCHSVTGWLRTLLLHIQRQTPETCDLWDIWWEWWRNTTWPTFWQFLDFFDNLWQFKIIFDNFGNLWFFFNNFDSSWQFWKFDNYDFFYIFYHFANIGRFFNILTIFDKHINKDNPRDMWHLSHW